MANVVGVRFRSGSKVYYFDPKELEIKQNDQVIVETTRGVECGRVVIAAREVEDKRVSQPLRSVVRAATEEDLAKEAANREKEREAYKVCREKIAEHGLDMKLIRAEYTFDGKKLLFYFTADGRIDFRDLVKDLASVFHMRIELRQVGVRDEAKMLGGIGICGRPFCCSTFLSDFAPVSIKMAKGQNLSLNPTKISGSCGRLMCCLANEQETYEYLTRNMPGVGDIVEAADGAQGKVQTVNVMRQSVRVIIEVDEDNKEMREYPVDELTILTRKRRQKNNQNKEGGGRDGAQAPGEQGADGAASGEKKKKRRNRHRKKGGEGRANPAAGGEAPQDRAPEAKPQGAAKEEG